MTEHEPTNGIDSNNDLESEVDAERETYTWAKAAQDLALTTRLTLPEAARLTHELQATELHPYDAMPQLARLILAAGEPSPHAAAAFGEQLRALLTGEESQ